MIITKTKIPATPRSKYYKDYSSVSISSGNGITIEGDLGLPYIEDINGDYIIDKQMSIPEIITNEISSGIVRASKSYISGNGNKTEGNNRVIVGDTNTSSVVRNMIIGTNNSVGGVNASCIGETNTNNGKSSMAVGYMNTISAERSLAVGNNNKLYKSQSIGSGLNNSVNSLNSFTTGAEHNTTGNYSFAAGAKATISKPYGFAFGLNNIVNGTSGGAFGLSNTINSNYSYAIGNNLANSNTNSVVVGSYNDDIQNLIFSVGCGNKEERKNAIEVTENKTTIRGDLEITGNIINLSSFKNESNLINKLKQGLLDINEYSSTDDILKALLIIKDIL